MWAARHSNGDAMNELVSLARMARRLGVTQRWLRDQTDAGRVPCLRAGRRLLYVPVAVQDALAELAVRQKEVRRD